MKFLYAYYTVFVLFASHASTRDINTPKDWTVMGNIALMKGITTGWHIMEVDLIYI